MKNSEKWMRGLPYVGNKGQKAQKIIDALPSGNRFIDVFGGGGSISLHACNTGEDYGGWDSDAFYAWLAECPSKQIYISEYTKLPNTEVTFNLGTKQSFRAVNHAKEELLLRYV